MNSTTAAQVISVQGFLYAEYGLLEELVSDDGPPFNSQELRNFLEYHGTRHLFSPVASPRSNGLAEVNVKSFKNTLIRQMLDPTTESRSLQEQVNAFLFAYRNTPHTATGLTPSELFHKVRPRTCLSLLHPLTGLRRHVQDGQQAAADRHGGSPRVFAPGNLVWVDSLRGGQEFSRPGVIVRVVSSVSYDVQIGNLVSHISADKLRPRDPRAVPIDFEVLPQHHRAS